jgi:hypothetical protein
VTHSLPRTTHTVDMDQIEELNRRLADPATFRRVVADDLGLADAPLLNRVDRRLPGTAVLVGLGWDGSPEFPYIHGRFSVAGGHDAGELLHVDLHTAALNALAHKLGVRQRWGF